MRKSGIHLFQILEGSSKAQVGLVALLSIRGPIPGPKDQYGAASNSHVRFILENGSIIWSGTGKLHMVGLERVQHRFLIWLAVSSNRPSASLDSAHLLKHLEMLCFSDGLA